LEQIEQRVAAVAADKKKDPKKFKDKKNAKLLRAIQIVVFDRIPQDPMNPRYRIGDTLGSENKHWFADSFGGARYRIFFRFDSKHKIIIYAWVNDEQTLRTYGSSSDAYAVFSRMLSGGNPPNSWGELLAACQKPLLVRVLESLKSRQ